MFTVSADRCHRRRLALGVCTLLLGLSGCAGLPRIDPTGERLFIWPQNQPAVVAPTIGNVQAPPVFTDPVFPQPELPATVGPAVVPGAVVTTPPPVIAPGVAVPQDTLTMTPDRVLAPVGSEVILRAGICTTENYLLTDQKVEWLIARESAGEIVDLGGKGCCRTPLLPWNKPQKIDNQYGIGYTAKMPLTITRGTADPSDDVKIEPGHAWASITSPVEGTSHVTAVTPAVDTWASRRATATIYWVDVVWIFPPAQIYAGGSQVMTTSVRRQTDGTPLVGWVVRYEVASGGGELSGGQSSQVVEVATGADGQASIDVTPTGSTGTVTQLNMELIRPEGLGSGNFPRLVVARGASTINWTSGQSTPYLPDLDEPVGTSPAIPAPDRDSTFSTQPIQPAPGGRPSLELEIRGESQVEVGAQTRFEVVIRNTGDGEATGVVLKSQYEQGLSHRMDRNKTMQIENSAVGNLAAGQSKTIYLDFDVVSSGRLCHNVTVRCIEGSETSRRACVDAASPAPRGNPALDVQKDGPRQATVGEVALFSIVVKNTGDVPLTNLEIVDEYDRAFSPLPVRQGYRIVDGAIVWNVPRLEVGASEKFEVQCTCLTPANRACGLVKVTDETPLLRVDDHCVEILPRRDATGGGAADAGAAAGEGTLRLQIVSFANPVRAGTSATYQILLANRAQTTEEQVELRVLFPAELRPDVTAIRNSASVRATLVGNELRFEPIAQVRPDEVLEFVIPVNVNQAGVGNIAAQVVSRAVRQPVEKTLGVEILGR